MVARIFDALGKPRGIISAPPFVWRLAFALAKPFLSHANVAMGARMADMVFDPAPAVRILTGNRRVFVRGLKIKMDGLRDALFVYSVAAIVAARSQSGTISIAVSKS